MLTWISKGKHHQEVAAIMELDYAEVRRHVYRTLDKMGAATSAGAVGIALREGIIK